MSLIIDHLEIDEKTISKQIKEDLKDDWFPDTLDFSDYFQNQFLVQRIAQNFKENGGKYVPSTRYLLNIPKSNFTLRYALETGLPDRAVYHAIALQLQSYFDRLISWQVYSHRRKTNSDNTDQKRSKNKYTFRNSIKAWADFVGCVNENLSHGKFLLTTDLANYFENINLRTLKEMMESLVPELKETEQEEKRVRGLVDQLFSYLKEWSFNEDRGLPQNRDASSFLANLYMRSIDSAMLSQGFQYFRYMDNIKIICDSEDAARKALKILIVELRKVGQFVNSGKTAIIDASNSEEIQKHIGTASIEMKRIASAWDTKSPKPIIRSFGPLKNLSLATLRAGSYDSREFRFCINRLITLANCKEFKVPPDFFSEITPLVIQGLDRAPPATDMICRYLRVVELSENQMECLLTHLSDPSKAFYNFKNYRVWILLTQRRFSSTAALDLARDTVRNRDDDPTRAGATIFLGAMGSLDDRKFIAERFSTLTSFLGQRAGLIGVHQLYFGQDEPESVSIKTHVGPYVRADLKGTYSILNKSDKAGTYCTELEPVSIANYLDTERDYD
jgi:hypothetical protein